MTDESVFAAALAIGNPSERANFLDRVCANNDELRKEVEELLAAHVASNALDRPVANLAFTGAYESPDDEKGRASIGDRVGPYKLLERIGEGGMGEVWVADQQEPIKRRVALKLIKPGMDTRSVLGRFEAERQALAVMDHPNIAKVLDAGTTPDGRPFFAMELVKGTPITEFCDTRKLNPRERLELFIPVCQAIQHAHMKGIIHRDIKPSNVLVALHDETPVPKVIDFGVAKAIGQQLTEKTVYTGFGALIGTPAYMAPEQATFNQLDIDTRADVYALGVMLYELLAGSPPVEPERLKKAALDEVLRIVRDEEPPRPSQRLSTSQAKATIAATRQTDPVKLSALMRGELDWIVMKALEKDRTRRYDTANALAKDVARYLAGDAVEACPPTLGYRLRKMYRRNRGAVLTASVVAIALVAGLIATSYGFYRADFHRQRAEGAERSAVENSLKAMGSADEAKTRLAESNAARSALEVKQQEILRLDYTTSMRRANEAWREHRFVATRDILNGTRPELRGWEWHYLNRQCQSGERFKLNGSRDAAMGSVSISPDGKWIASDNFSTIRTPVNGGSSFSTKSSVLIWDADTRQSSTLCDGIVDCCAVAFSHDSRRLLVAEWGKVTIRDRETRGILLTIPAHQNRIFGHAAWSPDGRRIATVSQPSDVNREDDGEIALWDAESGKQMWSIPKADSICPSVAFSPDGRWILVPVWKFNDQGPGGVAGRAVELYDSDTHEKLLEKAIPVSTRFATFSPTGTRFITSSYEGTATVWKILREGNRPVIDGTPVYLRGHRAGSVRFAFSPDGARIVTGNNDGTARIWDTETGRELRVLLGHPRVVTSVAFFPNGKQVATSSFDNTVRVWDADAPDHQTVVEDGRRVERARINRPGDRILTTTFARTTVWDVRTGKALLSLPGHDHAFSPDGRQIACVFPSDKGPKKKSNTVGLFDADSGHLIRELVHNAPYAHAPTFSPDGTLLLVQGRGRGVDLWNLQTREHWELGDRGETNGGCANGGFSPDGTKIWVERMGNKSTTLTGIVVYDTATREKLTTLDIKPVDYEVSWTGTLSQDGTRFLIVFSFGNQGRNEYRVWDMASTTGEPIRSFTIERESFWEVAFSPDAKRLIVPGWGQATILDTETGHELLSIRAESWVSSVSFDPTGQKVLLADQRRVVISDGTPMLELQK